jgi:DUF1365 family protein
MKSSIYEGTIRHRRFHPRSNTFQYRLFFMYMDLGELPTLFDLHPFWSYEKPNIAYFRRRDHFGDPSLPLDSAVRNLVEQHVGTRPNGPIRLLTHLRYFGHCFNPASFYYCYNRDDTHVDTIVIEIHNTPWGEHFCYVLDAAQNRHPMKNWRRHTADKVFHVSPFIDMNIRYDWRFKLPDESIRVHMIDYHDDTRLFDASLALERRRIDRRALTRVLLEYPAQTVRVITLIYWQALRLVMKKTPFYTHPRKRALSRGNRK